MNTPLYNLEYAYEETRVFYSNLPGLAAEDKIVELLDDADPALGGVLCTLADDHGQAYLAYGSVALTVTAVEEEA